MEKPCLVTRKSRRLKEYDYRRSGAYFVTICSKNNSHLFGRIVEGKVRLNSLGTSVQGSWLWLKGHYSYVDLDEWILMPNHLHGIIHLSQPDVPEHQRIPKTLGSLIGAFKTVSTKRINERRKTPGKTVWQRDFYDHIIRDDDDLARIRKYILENPLRWEFNRRRAVSTKSEGE